MLCGQFTSRACRLFRRPRDTPRQRAQGSGQSGSHRAAGVGVVLVSRWLTRRRSWTYRRLALGRAHELQRTRNIPRDQMKGLVERFGGLWNGYTWIDQTTYLETAGRDALDQLLFIEAERMANGLYEPEDCESERTVIISELQGGENDPDQLLDQEVTAMAFRAHHLSPSDDRLAPRSALDVARRSLRALPPRTTSRTTRRSSSPATSNRTMCCGASSERWARSPRHRCHRACRSSSRRRSASAGW